MGPIYLDYNATTPVDRRVFNAMKPYLELFFGNPSSSHLFGLQARKAVEHARDQVGVMLNANPDEIIFTSGGTESNNMALKGAAFALRGKGNHLITSSIEHPAILEVCHFLENHGFEVTYIPVDEYGMVNPQAIKEAITARTILVSVMHANNEVGTIQPVAEIGEITKSSGILFHTDAAQSVGKIPVDVQAIQADLLSVAGHKLYAPKGIGALYIRRGVKLEKFMHGANHESNLRAGTENVAQIAGLGAAAELVSQELSGGRVKTLDGCDLSELRDSLFKGIIQKLPEVKLNGHPEHRLPNTLSLGFPGTDASFLLQKMKGIAASAGAACHSDRTDISSVLLAMKIPDNYALGTIRFSVGRMTTEEEVTRAVEEIVMGCGGDETGFSLQDRVFMAQNGVLEINEEKSNMPEKNVGLTAYTHALGCACKIRPQLLERILKDLPVISGTSVLVGHETSDDAAVYAIDSERAIVQTVDFIPPIVDDPYMYGAIAAANSISDVYAMGGKPAFALSIVAFPDRLLPIEILKEIIRGATDKAKEANIEIIGGHTIEDNEPKFGLAVTGFVHPGKILRNSTAKAGDALILTKPIGTGILMTALKNGLANEQEISHAMRLMAELNRKPAEVMEKFPVNACTDVTGFGLLGHLKEMVSGAGVSAEIFSDKVPVLDFVMKHAAAGMIPGGTKNNLDFVSDVVDWAPEIPDLLKYVLCDAQTSGGLLISLPEDHSTRFLDQLGDDLGAVVIGRIKTGKPGITVI